MSDAIDKHATVGKPFEIDCTAINIFEGWLPRNWLLRKQNPDVFVDYVVEIVEGGEPTGLHFAAQVKGYEDTPNDPNLLKYSFQTKHLKYYLHRSQHPVVLFLINVTTREGYWFFAQKYLKEKVASKVLDSQTSLTIHFATEDNLLNFTKFKCLLPEAEQFVRNLHPGSVEAALKKRKAELESKDPRCSVSISIKDGKEQIAISAKEPFSFKARIRSKNIDGWRKFIESGASVKVAPGEMEIIGAPLLEEAFKTMSGTPEIQFGTQYLASVQFFCGAGENLSVIQADGKVSAGKKFVTFHGALPESPFEMTGEFPFDNALRDEATTTFTFSFDKWAGQKVVLLSHFDQIEALVRSLVASQDPKMRILVRGNVLWNGHLTHFDVEGLKSSLYSLEWLEKCRWIALHYNVNPSLPCIADIADEKWDEVEELYGLLKNNEISVPDPGHTFSFEASTTAPDSEFASEGVLSIGHDAHIADFFGFPVPLGPTRHTFNDVKLISRTPSTNGGSKFVFKTTEKTKRTSVLISK